MAGRLMRNDHQALPDDRRNGASSALRVSSGEPTRRAGLRAPELLRSGSPLSTVTSAQVEAPRSASANRVFEPTRCRSLRSRTLVSATAGLVALALVGIWQPPVLQAQSRSERIRELRRQIDEASKKAQAELEAIEASDRRLTEVNDLIAQTEAQLSEARTRVEEAQKVLFEAVSRVQAVEERLARAQVRYADARRKVEVRVVQLYKYGRTSGAEALLDSDSFEQVLLSSKYNQSIQQRDQRLSEAIAAAIKDLSETREELEKARKEAEHRRDVLRAEQERLEGILAEQKQLKAALETEIETHRKILAGIEADRAKLERALDELEGQSRRVSGFALSRGSGNGRLAWPCTGAVVSGFGMRVHPVLGYARMHTGVDIDCPNGAAVGSAASGIVVYAGWSGGYGNFVMVDHGDGLATAYAHLSRIQVSRGQSVTQGQTVGNVGSTGLSTGPHLHFEVRVNGNPVDPMRYF